MKDREILVLLKSINKDGLTDYNKVALETTIEQMETEIRDKENKVKAGTEITKAVKYILKSNKDERFDCEFTYDDDDNKYFTDGHQVLAIKGNYTHDKVKHNEIMQMKDLADNYKADITYSLPTYAELNSMLKNAKAEAKYNVSKINFITYTFYDAFTVNAEMLLNALLATGANKATRSISRYSIMKLEGNLADYYILPINVKGTEISKGLNVVYK